MEPSTRTHLKATLLGWALSRLILGNVPGLTVGGLWLWPGQLCFPLLFGRAWFCNVTARSPGLTFWTLAGWMADILVYMALRPGMGPVESSFWSTPSMVGSAIGLGMVMALCVLSHRPQTDPGAAPTPQRGAHLWLSVCVASVVTGVYRLSYQMTLHIPNEERSLMVASVEIHHINWGVLGCVPLAALGARLLRGPWTRVLHAVAWGFVAASYLDQCTYILLQDVSDAAYGEALSTWGAWTGVVVAAVAGALIRRVLPPRLRDATTRQ